MNNYTHSNVYKVVDVNVMDMPFVGTPLFEKNKIWARNIASSKLSRQKLYHSSEVMIELVVYVEFPQLLSFLHFVCCTSIYIKSAMVAKFCYIICNYCVEGAVNIDIHFVCCCLSLDDYWSVFLLAWTG